MIKERYRVQSLPYRPEVLLSCVMSLHSHNLILTPMGDFRVMCQGGDAYHEYDMGMTTELYVDGVIQHVVWCLFHKATLVGYPDMFRINWYHEASSLLTRADHHGNVCCHRTFSVLVGTCLNLCSHRISTVVWCNCNHSLPVPWCCLCIYSGSVYALFWLLRLKTMCMLVKTWWVETRLCRFQFSLQVCLLPPRKKLKCP